MQDVAQSVKDYKDDLRQTGQDVHKAADRVDDRLFNDTDSISNNIKKNVTGLSGVNQNDAASGFKKQEGAANALKNNVTGAPEELKNAALNEPEDKAGNASGEGATASSSGPISSTRKPGGEAQKVTKGQIDGAGREVPPQVAQAEKDFLVARG